MPSQGNRHLVVASATALLETSWDGNQMRRMLNETTCIEKGSGGVPFLRRDFAKSGVKHLAEISRATAELCTGVTCGTVFRETVSRSAVKQFVRQD